MSEEQRKRAPVQGWAAGIPWEMHLEAYSAYCKRYGRQQAMIEGGCRGGFHTEELDEFIPGWRERASAFRVVESALEKNDAALGTHAYCASESHLNGYRLVIVFDTLEQVQAAHQAIVDAGTRRHPQSDARAEPST